MSKYELYMYVDNTQKRLIRRLPLFLAKERIITIFKKGTNLWKKTKNMLIG